jgi:predicted RND superfamily exporter protein
MLATLRSFVSKGFFLWERTIVVLATIVCAWLTAGRLHVSGDLATLFPESGAAGALARWTRASGGREPAVVLIRGRDADDVASAADALAEALRGAPSIERVIERAPVPGGLRDPTLAWIHAGPAARARLARLVTPDGMRARLRETRALLLAPGGDTEAEAWLAQDPLRLAQVPWEGGAELAAGVRAAPGGEFIADGGRARLVLAAPRGSAFVSADARAVVEDVERAIATAKRSAPQDLTMEVSGGHAIAFATEALLKRDLALSGSLSLVLASAAFVATFGRARALVAVLPPLALGTLWTTGIAALLPSGLTAVSIAFAAVVVGVGVDTGVHVYAAVLDARRQGLAGVDAARAARDATWRPTLLAATVAGAAFASLGLSGLSAMRELGLLCAAGEVLTAVAIVLLTPHVGAWLERGTPAVATTPRWVSWLIRATSTGPRAAVALALCGSPLALLAVCGWPAPADALVAIRPSGLAPLVAGEHIREAFGGSPGQRIVLSVDADEGRARLRADRVAEALEPLLGTGVVEAYDAVSAFAPAEPTLRARLAERDRLDLPSRAGDLEAALGDVGFDLGACAPAVRAFAHPTAAPAPSADDPALEWLSSRHVAKAGPTTYVATFVRTGSAPGADDAFRAAVAAADPDATITGFHAIDRALRSALDRDLYLVGGAALVAVAVGLRVALRSARHALVALATLACEIGVVGMAMRALAVRWHVYDALVLPVLFGVTVDESMFLLSAARDRSIADALRAQAPLVASTALTTAAGFAALTVCRFSGLRDLGLVGAIGVLAGLAAALVVVPAALKIAGSR